MSIWYLPIDRCSCLYEYLVQWTLYCGVYKHDSILVVRPLAKLPYESLISFVVVVVVGTYSDLLMLYLRPFLLATSTIIRVKCACFCSVDQCLIQTPSLAGEGEGWLGWRRRDKAQCKKLSVLGILGVGWVGEYPLAGLDKTLLLVLLLRAVHIAMHAECI